MIEWNEMTKWSQGIVVTEEVGRILKRRHRPTKCESLHKLVREKYDCSIYQIRDAVMRWCARGWASYLPDNSVKWE